MRLRYLVAVFLVLSLGDLLLTWHLIESSGGIVYESNPLAGDILADHGWFGLAVFKSLFTLVVVLLGAIIALYRPRTGLLMFGAGNAVLLAVVGYSLSLVVTQPWDDLWADHAMALERDRGEQLQEELTETKLYSRKLEQLGAELASSQRTLPDAAADLSKYLKQRAYDPLAALRSQYAGFNDQACLSIVLLRHVACAYRHDPVNGSRVLATYQRQFERHYRVPLPSCAGVWQMVSDGAAQRAASTPDTKAQAVPRG